MPADRQRPPFPMPDSLAASAAPSRWWHTALQFALGAAVGIGAAWLGLALLPSGQWDIAPLAEVLAVALGFFVGGWLHIVLHELGHALAGRLAGLQLVTLAVGPWRLQRDQSGRWAIQRNRGLAGVGGFAVVVPRPGQAPNRLTESVMLVGGVAANLLFGVLGLWLAQGGWLGGFASIALALFGVIGLALGVMNLLPLRSAGWHNDGKALLDLWRGQHDALAGHRVRQLMALTMAEVRPRDWPAELLSDPTAIGDARLRMQAETQLLGAAMDRDDADTAAASARRLAGLWAGQGDGIRQMLALAIASHVARFEPDAATLRAWRAQGEGSLIDQTANLAWLDAEIAALEGRDGEARRFIANARDALPRCVFALEATLLGEDLQRLEARLSQARTPAARDAAWLPAATATIALQP